MTIDIIRFVILVVAVAAVGVYTYGMRRGAVTLIRLIPALFAAYALAYILFMAFLWLNHITYPFNLEAMELTVLVHVRRAMTGLPIYAEPASDFTALAYNPLYYYLSIPFAWLLGAKLFTLRLVSILAMAGSGFIIFLTVQRSTGSRWWALMALGLFAAAYRAMETYLDNALPDSAMLFAVLLGCYLIDQNRSPFRNLLGVFFTVVAFWFKQPGAFFAAGAVLYLTWRDGWRKSSAYWLLALVLGPGLYLAATDWLFGPRFRFFTSEMPRHWLQFDLRNILRVGKFLAKSYIVLAILSLATSVCTLLRERNRSSIWFAMLPVAIISGIPGFLDPESANNLYIPLGIWFIITAVIGLEYLTSHHSMVKRWGLHLLAVGMSFTLLYYSPASVIVSRQAAAAYQDLVSYLRLVDGPVYAPWIGQLQDGYEFYPAVHWVPMTDILRGPEVAKQGNATIRALLEPVLHPVGKAYILTSFPLEGDPALAFLTDRYVLDRDFGERFAPLTTLPKRFNFGGPRYLYKYVPGKADS
jgi:hypothetical protein